MYQYTTTNVINSQSVLDYDGNILYDNNGAAVVKYLGTASGLTVAKVGYFKTANILSIHKRPYSAGVKEIAIVTIPTIAAGLTARLDVVLKLSESTQSEYTNYSLDFLKPITVEVIATGTPATDAGALITQLNTLKDRFGTTYFKAELANTSDIQITCHQTEQRVKSLTISNTKNSENGGEKIWLVNFIILSIAVFSDLFWPHTYM